jgi:hypothetical protein
LKETQLKQIGRLILENDLERLYIELQWSQNRVVCSSAAAKRIRHVDVFITADVRCAMSQTDGRPYLCARECAVCCVLAGEERARKMFDSLAELASLLAHFDR